MPAHAQAGPIGRPLQQPCNWQSVLLFKLYRSPQSLLCGSVSLFLTGGWQSGRRQSWPGWSLQPSSWPPCQQSCLQCTHIANSVAAADRLVRTTVGIALGAAAGREQPAAKCCLRIAIPMNISVDLHVAHLFTSHCWFGCEGIVMGSSPSGANGRQLSCALLYLLYRLCSELHVPTHTTC